MNRLPTPGAQRRTARSTSRFRVESLEPRTLFSVVGWVGIIAPDSTDFVRRFAGNVYSPDNPNAEIHARLVIAYDDPATPIRPIIWNSGEFIANKPTVNDHPLFNPTGHAFDESPAPAVSASSDMLLSATAYLYALDPTTQQWLAVDTVKLPSRPPTTNPNAEQLIGRAALNPNGSGLSIGEDPSYIPEIEFGPGPTATTLILYTLNTPTTPPPVYTAPADIASGGEDSTTVTPPDHVPVGVVGPIIPGGFYGSIPWHFIVDPDFKPASTVPSNISGKILLLDEPIPGASGPFHGTTGWAYDSNNPDTVLKIRLVTTRTYKPGSEHSESTDILEAHASADTTHFDEVPGSPLGGPTGHNFAAYYNRDLIAVLYARDVRDLVSTQFDLYAQDPSNGVWVRIDSRTKFGNPLDNPNAPTVPTYGPSIIFDPTIGTTIEIFQSPAKAIRNLSSLTFLTKPTSFFNTNAAASFTSATFGDPKNYTLTVQLSTADTKKKLIDSI